MGHRAAAPSPMQRIRRALAAVAAVSMALVFATAAGARGTYALWSDTLDIGGAATITSGAPELVISGFDGLNFEYSVLPPNLSTSTNVTVKNAGDVPLTNFQASMSGSGLTGLLEQISVSFTPVSGGSSTTISEWLSGLTLAPNTEVEYIVSTLVTGSLLGLLGDVTTTVEVTAQAGTSWAVSASDEFTQSVGVLPVVPPDEDFNMAFADYGGGHNIDIAWTNPSDAPTTAVYHVFVNGIQLPDQGNYWYPHFSLSSSNLPTSLIPAEGQVVTLTITVFMDDNPDAIARGTLWAQGLEGHWVFLLTDPTAAASTGAVTSAAEPGPARTSD